MWFLILGAVLALLFGIWVGLGWPGVNRGRVDRITPPGHARRLRPNHIHWIRTRR
jgi:hypothetical protein